MSVLGMLIDRLHAQSFRPVLFVQLSPSAAIPVVRAIVPTASRSSRSLLRLGRRIVLDPAV